MMKYLMVHIFQFEGSGKTYTMGTGNYSYLDEDERGIIPCAVSDIFTHTQVSW